MDATKKTAHIAGLLYFVAALFGVFGLVYAPSRLIVSGDATVTANNLRASGWLLRLGIGGELIGHVIFLFMVLVLHRLFRAVNEDQARLVVILGALLSVPIAFLNAVNEIAALLLVSGADFLKVFEPRQLDAMALFFLKLHDQGLTVASVFWGLWLFPFGMLVIRSGFIPRVFGALLMIAGCAYLASSFTELVVPQYEAIVGPVAAIVRRCEAPIIFWLLIWGARDSTRLTARTPG